MLARDVMTSPAITVAPDAEVRDIAKLLLERRISGVPVVDAEGTVLGVVSEGDLMRVPEARTRGWSSLWLAFLVGPEERARRYVKSHGRFAHEMMTRPAITVPETATLAEVAATLARHRIKRVPVVRDGKVTGIVSRANVLHGLASMPVAAPPLNPSDSELRTQVLDALRGSGARTTLVNALVSDGVAQLWGAVESREEKEALRVAAENVPGIRRIEDNVSVLPDMVSAVLGAE